MELILVMAILAIVAGAGGAETDGWREAGKLSNSADEFIAATRFARAQAVSSGYVCVVAIDKQERHVRRETTERTKFTNVEGEFGQPLQSSTAARSSPSTLARRRSTRSCSIRPAACNPPA